MPSLDDWLTEYGVSLPITFPADTNHRRTSLCADWAETMGFSVTIQKTQEGEVLILDYPEAG